jgi:hypothetical protein
LNIVVDVEPCQIALFLPLDFVDQEARKHKAAFLMQPLPARVPAGNVPQSTHRPRNVSQGKLVTIENYFELFNGILPPKQIEGLRLLVTPLGREVGLSNSRDGPIPRSR